MLKIIHGDIIKIKSECIINPSNGLGVMTGGISISLLRAGGPEILNSAKETCFKNGLYKAGESYLGSSGFLIDKGIKKIVHAVIKTKPSQKLEFLNCEKALSSAMELVKSNFKSVSVPAFGIEARKTSIEDSAKMMLKVLKNYENINIFLVDNNLEFIETIKKMEKL